MINFNKADFLTSYGTIEQMTDSDRWEVAFAGRSNVGKSSLINKLVNRKSLARVSSMPGKTATINFYTVDDIHVVDLPGYGYAKIAKSEKHRWSDLIEGYFNQDRKFSLVVLLIDMRHKASELDIQMVDYLISTELPFIIAFTKSDKLNATQTKERTEGFIKELPCGDQIEMVFCSSQTGKGIDRLKEVIEQAVDVSIEEYEQMLEEQRSLEEIEDEELDTDEIQSEQQDMSEEREDN